MGSACLEMGEKVYLKSWFKVACSPRFSQIVPKWHLGGQPAGRDFFNIRVRCNTQKSSGSDRERNRVDSAGLDLGGKVYLKSWGRYTQIVPKWHLGGHLGGREFFNTHVAR